MKERSSPNKLIQADENLMKDYKARLAEARRAVGEMGRGTQARLARDMGTNPSWISQVLRGDVVSLTALMQIEAWLKENYEPQKRKP